ncbi:MAG: hypothetical protein JO061_20320 [Acidobacteriaceae bacterium]|nr:hypothetical protein [Acidobacteriaceae bacterium]
MIFDYRAGLAGIALLLASPVVFAGPRISIGDPGTGTPVGMNFTFASNASGGGYFTFDNASGVNWFSMDFQVSEPTGTAITCVPGPLFNTCESSVLSTSGNLSMFDVGFDNPTEGGGIPAGGSFTVDLNNEVDGHPNTDPNGAGQWLPGTEFTAIANLSTPEPGTFSLLFGALAVYAGGRIYRKRRSSLPRRIS